MKHDTESSQLGYSLSSKMMLREGTGDNQDVSMPRDMLTVSCQGDVLLSGHSSDLTFYPVETRDLHFLNLYGQLWPQTVSLVLSLKLQKEGTTNNY